MILPWLPRRREAAAAVVSLANCNGCGRCFADCPYSAVIMQPRTDGLPYDSQAVGGSGFVHGLRHLRRRLSHGHAVPAHHGTGGRASTCRCCRCARCANARWMPWRRFPGRTACWCMAVAAAAIWARWRQRASGWSRCLASAALPPSFIDFAISRRHADGVMLVGCAAGDCYQRLGMDWMEQRLAGQRDPYLRGRVPREPGGHGLGRTAGRRGAGAPDRRVPRTIAGHGSVPRRAAHAIRLQSASERDARCLLSNGMRNFPSGSRRWITSIAS